jgi:hypothetical protein
VALIIDRKIDKPVLADKPASSGELGVASGASVRPVRSAGSRFAAWYGNVEIPSVNCQSS